jgi:hypothetical protein
LRLDGLVSAGAGDPGLPALRLARDAAVSIETVKVAVFPQYPRGAGGATDIRAMP